MVKNLTLEQRIEEINTIRKNASLRFKNTLKIICSGLICGDIQLAVLTEKEKEKLEDVTSMIYEVIESVKIPKGFVKRDDNIYFPSYYSKKYGFTIDIVC